MRNNVAEWADVCPEVNLGDIFCAACRRVCLKCGAEMILRRAKSCSDIEQQFWGCSNFPRCRSLLPCP
ncbi:topoisomerase DNA-binding C4 zinc finger domain-containing protein [Syntrophorhabdus aromaticivorans]|uniref:topoisomerase DNA-binding C4 zinc finger domain-containing protein n=1 Tax=Syntrophorhabdus aromaticivorans TaxID=328301 RepID=UPI000A035439